MILKKPLFAIDKKKGVNDEVENNNTIHFDQFTAAITYNTIKSHWIIIVVGIDGDEAERERTAVILRHPTYFPKGINFFFVYL